MYDGDAGEEQRVRKSGINIRFVMQRALSKKKIERDWIISCVTVTGVESEKAESLLSAATTLFATTYRCCPFKFSLYSRLLLLSAALSCPTSSISSSKSVLIGATLLQRPAHFLFVFFRFIVG